MTTTTNLWGDLPVLEATDRSPAVILDEQGNQLSALTKHVLSGEVVKRPTRDGGRFDATLFIVAQLLDEYRYAVCRAEYSPVELYPCKLYDLASSVRQEFPCQTETELYEALKHILQSDKVRKVVSALMRESGAKGAG